MREKIKQNIDLQNYNNRVYIHSYYSRCENMHTYTHADMGCFGTKMCKFEHFFYYRHIDAIALKDSNLRVIANSCNRALSL